MTDFLNRFGKNVAGSSSAGAAVMFGDVLDFGPIDADAAMRTHRTGEAPDETVVFSGDASKVSGVSLYHSGDNSTFTALVSMPVDSAVQGDFAFLPFPVSHKRYVKAALTQKAASLAADVISARIEPGASAPRS
jgi:hypothetical protein